MWVGDGTFLFLVVAHMLSIHRCGAGFVVIAGWLIDIDERDLFVITALEYEVGPSS